MDLVEVQLKQGRPRVAHETARRMLRRIRHTKNRVIANAVLKLLRHGQKGLDLTRLEDARKKILKGKKQRR